MGYVILHVVLVEQKIACSHYFVSFDIFRGTSRYDYTHAILNNEESYFKGTNVPKARRISIVCRNDVN